MEAEKEEAPVPEEVWAKRKAARQRQIDIGKARSEYTAYTDKVPPKSRTASHPRTPDPNDRISKRAFDKKLSVWRRCLHEYDSDQERTDPRYVLTTFSPTTDCTESTRAGSEEASSPPPPLPPYNSRQQTKPLSFSLAELLPLSGSAPSVASRSTDCSSGSWQHQAAAVASRDHLLWQPRPTPLQSPMVAGLPASSLPRPLPVGLHYAVPPNAVPNVRPTPHPGQAPVLTMAQLQAQMAVYSGLLWQMPSAPVYAHQATPWVPAGASPQPAPSPSGQAPLGPCSQMPHRQQMQPAPPLWASETPGLSSRIDGPAQVTQAAPEHSWPSRETQEQSFPGRDICQERHFSCSSSNSADADANPVALSGGDKATVQASTTKPHLEVSIAGDSKRADGDSEPHSPVVVRKQAVSEPKTPPMKSVPHAYESPVPGNVNRRSPASNHINTPSPQAGYLRQSACKLNVAQNQPAQQSLRAQANNHPVYRMAAPTGLSMAGPPGQLLAAPTGLPGQPATPVQRSPLFAWTPGQGPSSGGGMQAGWGSASGSASGMGPSMFSPTVFQFKRPEPYVVTPDMHARTPAPPLPFGSPPLRAGNGLTPGPKHTPPDGYNCSQDRATAMNEWRSGEGEKWRRSGN